MSFKRNEAARVLVFAVVLAAAGTAFAQTPPPSTTPSPDDAVGRARALRGEGKAAEAEALLRQVLQGDESNMRAIEELAEAAADQGRDKEAVRLYERVVAEEPTNMAARLRLADFYLYVDQNEAALEHCLVVLENRPNDPSIHYKVASILLAVDRTVEAIPHLTAYLDAVPGDLDAREDLYQAYLWTDQPDHAVETLEVIARARPDDMDLAAKLAERYVDVGKEKEAVALYERVVAARPADADARRALGELYEWNGQPRKALVQYEKCLEVRPLDSETRARALDISLDLGLGRRARSHAAFLDPANPAWTDLTRQAVTTTEGVGTSIGAGYRYFQYREGFAHHSAGPTFTLAVSDEVTPGAYYRFHHLSGPYGGGERTVLGHEGGLFGEVKLPAGFTLGAGLSVTRYDDGWLSVGGSGKVLKEFDGAAIELALRRADWLTTMGDVAGRIVANSVALLAWVDRLEPVFFNAGLEYARFSDSNDRMFGEAGVGVTIVKSPRLEAAWDYSIDHYSDSGPGPTYFNPSHYQLHGPRLGFRHAVATWFQYGLDLKLMHAIEDSDLLLAYGASVVLRPGRRHVISGSYLRTDSVLGRGGGRYYENLGTAAYTFEF